MAGQPFSTNQITSLMGMAPVIISGFLPIALAGIALIVAIPACLCAFCCNNTRKYVKEHQQLEAQAAAIMKRTGGLPAGELPSIAVGETEPSIAQKARELKPMREKAFKRARREKWCWYGFYLSAAVYAAGIVYVALGIQNVVALPNNAFTMIAAQATNMNTYVASAFPAMDSAMSGIFGINETLFTKYLSAAPAAWTTAVSNFNAQMADSKFIADLVTALNGATNVTWANSLFPASWTLAGPAPVQAPGSEIVPLQAGLSNLKTQLNQLIGGIGSMLSGLLNSIKTSTTISDSLTALSTMDWPTFAGQLQNATCTYFWCNLIPAGSIANVSAAIQSIIPIDSLKPAFAFTSLSGITNVWAAVLYPLALVIPILIFLVAVISMLCKHTCASGCFIIMCPWTCTCGTALIGTVLVMVSFISSAVIVPSMNVLATNATQVTDFVLSAMNSTSSTLTMPTSPIFTFTPTSLTINTTNTASVLNTFAVGVGFGGLINGTCLLQTALATSISLNTAGSTIDTMFSLTPKLAALSFFKQSATTTMDTLVTGLKSDFSTLFSTSGNAAALTAVTNTALTGLGNFLTATNSPINTQLTGMLPSLMSGICTSLLGSFDFFSFGCYLSFIFFLCGSMFMCMSYGFVTLSQGEAKIAKLYKVKKPVIDLCKKLKDDTEVLVSQPMVLSVANQPPQMGMFMRDGRK